MKLYLAGPMSAIPSFNFPAFDSYAKRLAGFGRGHEVVSPAEIDSPEMRAACLASEHGDLADLPPGESYGALLGRDIEIVIDDVDGVFALQDWEKSRGARIEVFTAVQMGKPVYSAEKWEEAPSRVRPETREYLDEYCALTDEELSAGLGGGIGVLQSRVEEGGYTPALEQVKAVFKRVSDVDLGGGEVRTTSATGGEKGVKPERLDLIPPGFLEELGRVYGEGAKKYSDVNYLFGYEWRKSIGAGLRHWMRFLQGEDIDPETGCHHLAHAAWHCATLITYQTEGLGTDDRLFHAIEQSKRGEL